MISEEVKILQNLISQRIDGLKCWRHYRNSDNPVCNRCWYCQVNKINFEKLVATIINMEQENNRLIVENKRMKHIVDECSQTLSLINSYARD